MPIIQDSIPLFNDSLKIVSDSLAKLHSIDSMQQVAADSIRHIAAMPSGFVGKPLPETLNTNPIVTISILILFLLFGFVLSYGRKMILETTKDFFYLKERSSIFIDSSANALRLKISFMLISLGSIGFFLFSIYFKDDTITAFNEKLLYLSLFIFITLGFLAFKFFVFKALSYIFFDKNTTSIFIRGYFTIIFGLGIALSPVVIGLIYTPKSFFIIFLSVGLLLFFIAFILILYKIIQIFLDNFYSLFYIMLYLCTLEILPVLIVLKALS